MAYEIVQGEGQFLEVEVQGTGRSRRVPLAGSLPIIWTLRLMDAHLMDGDAAEVEKLRFFYDLFREYVGPAVDVLTTEELGQLIEAWSAATEQATGATPGE